MTDNSEQDRAVQRMAIADFESLLDTYKEAAQRGDDLALAAVRRSLIVAGTIGLADTPSIIDSFSTRLREAFRNALDKLGDDLDDLKENQALQASVPAPVGFDSIEYVKQMRPVGYSLVSLDDAEIHAIVATVQRSFRETLEGANMRNLPSTDDIHMRSVKQALINDTVQALHKKQRGWNAADYLRFYLKKENELTQWVEPSDEAIAAIFQSVQLALLPWATDLSKPLNVETSILEPVLRLLRSHAKLYYDRPVAAA